MNIRYILIIFSLLWSQGLVAEEIAAADKDVQVPLSGGNDVYNFYFQKAEGPKTVQQGGPDVQVKTKNGQVTEVSTSEDEEMVEEVVEDDEESLATTSPKNKLDYKIPTRRELRKKWTARAGFGHAPTFDDVGYLLGARYRINRYIDFTGEVIVPGGERSFEFGEADWHLGTTLTPIHIQIFGWDALWLSVTTGAFSGKRNEKIFMDFSRSSERVYGFFAGGMIRINFTKKFGVEYFVRGDGYNGATAGLLVDFKF